MRIVVFDIETTNWLADTGSSDPASLTIALVGIHDSETGYSSYIEQDLPKLWPIIERTDVLIGWNSDHFDIPLLNKYYPGDLTRIKSVDLMKEFQPFVGRRLKLDAVAEGTLKDKKLDGKGGQSIIWWRNGEVEKVREYCLKDVELTKKIFDYALEKKSIKYAELGSIREVKIDTSKWLIADTKPMTFSLGF